MSRVGSASSRTSKMNTAPHPHHAGTRRRSEGKRVVAFNSFQQTTTKSTGTPSTSNIIIRESVPDVDELESLESTSGSFCRFQPLPPGGGSSPPDQGATPSSMGSHLFPTAKNPSGGEQSDEWSNSPLSIPIPTNLLVAPPSATVGGGGTVGGRPSTSDSNKIPIAPVDLPVRTASGKISKFTPSSTSKFSSSVIPGLTNNTPSKPVNLFPTPTPRKMFSSPGRKRQLLYDKIHQLQQQQQQPSPRAGGIANDHRNRKWENSGEEPNNPFLLPQNVKPDAASLDQELPPATRLRFLATNPKKKVGFRRHSPPAGASTARRRAQNRSAQNIQHSNHTHQFSSPENNTLHSGMPDTSCSGTMSGTGSGSTLQLPNETVSSARPTTTSHYQHPQHRDGNQQHINTSSSISHHHSPQVRVEKPPVVALHTQPLLMDHTPSTQIPERTYYGGVYYVPRMPQQLDRNLTKMFQGTLDLGPGRSAYGGGKMTSATHQRASRHDTGLLDDDDDEWW